MHDPDPRHVQLGLAMRAVRRHLGYPQKLLAHRMGCTRQHLSAFENGRDLPIPDTWRRWLEAVGATDPAGSGRDQQLHGLLQRARNLYEPAQPHAATQPGAVTGQQPSVIAVQDASLGWVGTDHSQGGDVRRAAFLGLAASRLSAGDGDSSVPGVAAEFEGRVREIRRALLHLDPVSGGVHGVDDTERPRPLGEARRMVDSAYRLRQASRYLRLGATLPTLLTTAQRAAQEHSADQQRVAYGVLAEANHVAAAFLKKAGRPELAWVAVDRGVAAAERTESVLLRAVSGYRLANLLLDTGQLGDAAEVASQAIDLLEPGVGTGVPPYLSMWGALLLKRSVIAARQGDTATTWECIGEARAAARQLGEDRNDFWTAFGPTNVAIHEVSVAVELSECGKALRRVGAVDLTRLPEGLLERRARFLVDVARGYAGQRQDAEALHALLAASQIAPEDLRHSRHAQALVRGLLARERTGALPGLRELAARSGIHA